MDNDDFIFATKEDAQRAWKRADRTWTDNHDGEAPPEGALKHVVFKDGKMEPCDTFGGGWWMVVDNAYGEYMVTNIDSDHQWEKVP
jgi:hypothetical protein